MSGIPESRTECPSIHSPLEHQRFQGVYEQQYLLPETSKKPVRLPHLSKPLFIMVAESLIDFGPSTS
jgi:hypothetical protein